MLATVMLADSFALAADGLGPGAGWIVLLFFGGAAILAALVLGAIMAFIGWLFLKAGPDKDEASR